jgi:hypothetical protein
MIVGASRTAIEPSSPAQPRAMTNAERQAHYSRPVCRSSTPATRLIIAAGPDVGPTTSASWKRGLSSRRGCKACRITCRTVRPPRRCARSAIWISANFRRCWRRRENPRINGAQSVPEPRSSSHRAARIGRRGDGKPAVALDVQGWLSEQPSVNAGLRPPPSAAVGVDRGPPNSRLHLIEQWPGAAGRVQRISCQLFGSSRLCADSPRHRQAIVPPRGFVTDHPHPYPGRCKGASCAIRSARPGRCAASISSKQYPMRGQDWTRIGGWNWKRFDRDRLVFHLVGGVKPSAASASLPEISSLTTA